MVSALYFNMSSTKSKQSELSVKSFRNIDGFFGKQQYAAIALNIIC
jgi:hypothetical protein